MVSNREWKTNRGQDTPNLIENTLGKIVVLDKSVRATGPQPKIPQPTMRRYYSQLINSFSRNNNVFSFLYIEMYNNSTYPHHM